MSDQTPNQPTKPISESSGSSSSHSTPDQKPNRKRVSSRKYHVPERMETFPKPNTFPRNWDLSSIYKTKK